MGVVVSSPHEGDRELPLTDFMRCISLACVWVLEVLEDRCIGLVSLRDTKWV